MATNLSVNKLILSGVELTAVNNTLYVAGSQVSGGGGGGTVDLSGYITTGQADLRYELLSNNTIVRTTGNQTILDMKIFTGLVTNKIFYTGINRAIDLTNGDILDATSAISINWATRTLRNSTNGAVLNWSPNNLYLSGEWLGYSTGNNFYTLMNYGRVTGISGALQSQLGGPVNLSGYITTGQADIRYQPIGAVATVTGKFNRVYNAGSMVLGLTSGATYIEQEIGFNKPVRSAISFSPTQQEYIQWSERMPKSWNDSQISAQIEWSHATGTLAGSGISFILQSQAFSSNDTMDTQFAGGISITGIGGSGFKKYSTIESQLFTISGSPQDGDEIYFQMYRDVNNANDTLDVNAYIHSVIINYYTNSSTDD